MRKVDINNMGRHGLKSGSSPEAGMDVGGHPVGSSILPLPNLLPKHHTTNHWSPTGEGQHVCVK